MELRFIEVSRIVPDEDQPRRAIDDTALTALADSIKQHGILNPITVIPLNGVDGFRIVTGERRWRASQMAGMEAIPCIVREEENDAAGKTTEQLIENLQREDLAPLDKAQAIRMLKERLNATNREVGQRLGVSERTIGYLLDLLDLPETIAEQVVSSPNRPADGNITEKHARFLRQLNDEPELQSSLVEKIREEKLSADDTGRIARALKTNPDRREDILSASLEALPTVLDISGDTLNGPPPFSTGRAFVGYLEKALGTIGEIKVESVSGAELETVETAAIRVKEAIDRLIGELRAARNAG
ncbi:MAG: ParB/RepB/Spo0J family partition protein [Capsulimonadales bacterium]|nr:ParB/RepB/Spo0J family partition protein [Capsulimonadales bacterium]